MKRLTFFMVAIMALCLTAIAQKQSSKTLVAYFSATGTTEKAAKVVAEVTGGTLYEIQPAKKYTSGLARQVLTQQCGDGGCQITSYFKLQSGETGGL